MLEHSEFRKEQLEKKKQELRFYQESAKSNLPPPKTKAGRARLLFIGKTVSLAKAGKDREEAR